MVMLKKFARIGGLAALVGCLAVSPALAQQSTATVNGTIADQGGGVLPGVVITATNEATQVSREGVTDGEGIFILTAIPPGTYTLSAGLPGFQTVEQTGIVIQVGQNLSFDFTLGVGGVAETVTVTGESPLVNTTSSRIGYVVTEREIDSIPSQGRTQFGLVQLVPGVTPDLGALGEGDFEGDAFYANGQSNDRNQWNVDGVSNQQSNGGGSGPQARISLDATAEFQVLTHQYTAETGGASGVIINAITKSGTNQFSGRGFYFNTSEKLSQRNEFLPDGEDKQPASQHISGFSLGGPMVRDKAFIFFNVDSIRQRASHIHTFPGESQSRFANYNATEVVRRFATLLRLDYTEGNHGFRFTWAREPKPSMAQGFDCCATLDQRRAEMSVGDRSYNGGWTAIIGNRATNELIISRIGEERIVTNLAMANISPSDYLTDGWLTADYVGLNGRDQFDIGSENAYADFDTGLRDAHSGRITVLPAVKNTFTFAGNRHTFKAGGTWDKRNGTPEYRGNRDNGSFQFRHNIPFDPANAFSYPSRFRILMGNIVFDESDTFWNAFVHDQWRVGDNLTLDLGVRWDYQEQLPDQKDAFAPRLGFAYDPTSTGRTVIRGGIGKFYDYHFLGVPIRLLRNGLFSQTFQFDTRTDRSAAQGVIPTRHICLQPVLSDDGRLAEMSPACRAAMVDVRNSLQPGGASFINDEPLFEAENRRMGYLWGYSIGVQHQLAPDLAVSVSFVGNRGYDQMGTTDINEGPEDADGVVTRLGVDTFDPDGVLVPAIARGTDFEQVLRYVVSPDFNSQFDSLETTLEKRFSDGWSARASYTLAKSQNTVDTFGFSPERNAHDRDPRRDFGRTTTDNRHAFAMGVNVNPWSTLTIGGMVRAYSGYPINETIGDDANDDGEDDDRPCAGVHDLDRPILSALDSGGCALKNGIDGNALSLVDLTVRYTVNLPGPGVQTIGFYFDVYNVMNKVNFGNPSGERLDDNFLVPVVAGRPREAQVGIRYTF